VSSCCSTCEQRLDRLNLPLDIDAQRRCDLQFAILVDVAPGMRDRPFRDGTVARQEQLQLTALQAELGSFRIEQDYDTIVAIGLLMFFPRGRALALLRQIRERVRPGGRVIVNVLIEGTTYLGMFNPDAYYLFGANELEEAFAGWTSLAARRDSFPAPEGTRKEFATVVAQKPQTLTR